MNQDESKKQALQAFLKKMGKVDMSLIPTKREENNQLLIYVEDFFENANALKLTEWETSFLTDMWHRLTDGKHLSPKQKQKIRELYERHF